MVTTSAIPLRSRRGVYHGESEMVAKAHPHTDLFGFFFSVEIGIPSVGGIWTLGVPDHDRTRFTIFLSALGQGNSQLILLPSLSEETLSRWSRVWDSITSHAR